MDPRLGQSLHMIPQYQLLGVWMQVDLLVHPVGHREAVQGLAEAAATSGGAASAKARPQGAALNRYPVPDWVHQQVYLHPYPRELMLRNHV